MKIRIMKNNKAFLLLSIAGLFGLGACTDGYEPEPVENFTLDYVFSTTDSVGTQAVNFLNNIYRHLRSGHNRVGGDYLDAASDDAISINYDDSQVYKLAMGRYTASSRIGDDMFWDSQYQTIREASIFIANIDRVPFNLTYVKGDEVADENGQFKQSPLNETMKSEARFLRALAYFELVKRYGGVPLLGDKVYTLEDDLEIPRNTFAECVDYITSELELAKKDLRGLPMRGSDGNNYTAVPTREACDALKSRVLLFAASKLFNEDPIEKGNALVGYESYDANRWKVAADAAKDFIKTYGHEGTGAINLNPDFRNVFLSFYGAANPEVIWVVQDQFDSYALETTNGPLGFSAKALGHGQTLPTQNLVEAFPMLDGKQIGQSSKYRYTMDDQYSNRDPRLEMTVLHNGSNWLGTNLATYQGGYNNPANQNLYTRTSYYMAKFLGDYTSGTKEYSNALHPWVMFRYAEILLNYAEAMNEYAGPNADGVKESIIMLRKRAGIEAGDDGLYGVPANATKEEMRELIYNERRVEMAFEEQRYFDIRRWRLAENIFASPVKGLTITNRDGMLNYAETALLNVQWDNKRYLYPIPYSEVLKNSNMIQNPQW